MLRKVLWYDEGFTLPELLITLAILSILTGVVTLGLRAPMSRARSISVDAERKAVQTAIDSYMAHNGLDEIEERVGPAVIQSDDEDVPFTDYLRDLPTMYAYTWTSDGSISLQSQ